MIKTIKLYILFHKRYSHIKVIFYTVFSQYIFSTLHIIYIMYIVFSYKTFFPHEERSLLKQINFLMVYELLIQFKNYVEVAIKKSHTWYVVILFIGCFHFDVHRQSSSKLSNNVKGQLVKVVFLPQNHQRSLMKTCNAVQNKGNQLIKCIQIMYRTF